MLEEYRENQKEFLATKEDLNATIVEDLKKDLNATKDGLIKEISRIELKIEQLRTELIKWMFIFGVGQFAAIVGTLTAILFAFFKG